MWVLWRIDRYQTEAGTYESVILRHVSDGLRAESWRMYLKSGRSKLESRTIEVHAETEGMVRVSASPRTPGSVNEKSKRAEHINTDVMGLGWLSCQSAAVDRRPKLYHTRQVCDSLTIAGAESTSRCCVVDYSPWAQYCVDVAHCAAGST